LYHQNEGIVKVGAFNQEALVFEVVYVRQEASLGLQLLGYCFLVRELEGIF
jgi:hypothetical protein